MENERLRRLAQKVLDLGRDYENKVEELAQACYEEGYAAGQKDAYDDYRKEHGE